MKFYYYPLLILALAMTVSKIYTMEEGARQVLSPAVMRNALAGSLSELKLRAKKGVFDKPIYDPNGNTQLHYAVWSNDPEKVDFILGINPELLTIRNKYSETPLDVALQKNNKQIIQELKKGHEFHKVVTP